MENPVYDMNDREYNLSLAEAIKQLPEFQKPDWIDYVKSSPNKERPIDEEDFWYKRAASILKQLYKKNVVGVNRLRTKYGGRKNRGMAPERFQKAGGKIIRTILQQADAAGLTEKIEKDKRFKGRRMGRKLTQNGRNFLESIKPIEKKDMKNTEEKKKDVSKEKKDNTNEELKKENMNKEE